MTRRALAERPSVVKIFDRKGIVEIDGDGDFRDLVKPGVRRMSRDEGRLRAPRRLRKPPRCGGHDLDVSGGLARLVHVVGHEQARLEFVRQNAGELQGADAHAGHTGTDGLGSENDDHGKKLKV